MRSVHRGSEQPYGTLVAALVALLDGLDLFHGGARTYFLSISPLRQAAHSGRYGRRIRVYGKLGQEAQTVLSSGDPNAMPSVQERCYLCSRLG